MVKKSKKTTPKTATKSAANTSKKSVVPKMTKDPLVAALTIPSKPKKSFGFSSAMLFLGCMFVGLGIGQLAGMSGTGILIGMGAGFLAMYYSRE